MRWWEEAIKPRYAGRHSKWFWDRVNKVPDANKDEVYALGLAIQVLEEQVLASLVRAEQVALSKPDNATPPPANR